MEKENLPPARKVVSRSPVRTVRVLNLPGLLDSPVECESSLERDFVYRAALCPTLVRLRHQPFQIKLSSGRTYTPDFLVTERDGSAKVVEVKPATKVGGYRGVFDEVASRLKARQIAFLVLTDDVIRTRRAHERAALILRYRKFSSPAADSSRVLAALLDHGGALAFSALLHRARVELPTVLHLMAQRTLVTSRDLPVQGASRVSLANILETRHAVHLEGWFGVAPWGTHPGSDPAV
jgi:hypothetical protein